MNAANLTFIGTDINGFLVFDDGAELYRVDPVLFEQCSDAYPAEIEDDE